MAKTASLKPSKRLSPRSAPCVSAWVRWVGSLRSIMSVVPGLRHESLILRGYSLPLIKICAKGYIPPRAEGSAGVRARSKKVSRTDLDEIRVFEYCRARKQGLALKLFVVG